MSPNEAAGGSSPRLRKLLPASERPPASVAGFRPRQRMRLSQVSAACSCCRKQKAKCSGERPACQRCVRLCRECQYTTKPGETEAQARSRDHRDLKGRASSHSELVELLVNLPETEAQAVLQRIRAGVDIATIVNHVKAGNLLIQMAIVPETRLRYSFPYSPHMPEDCMGNNPYLDSLIYEASSLYSARGPARSAKKLKAASSSDASLGSEEQQALYLKPFHAAEVVDPRLSDVKISSWTSVCKDDVLMRDLLMSWLRCEYQFTAAFQKDLFLEDMATLREDHCSSLLVNVMLGYSCVCYPPLSNRAEYWNPQTLTYRFIAEAKRLWELEADQPRITTVQAGMLFNVFYNLCGLDEVGQVYRLQAITLAHRMKLLDRVVVGQDERLNHGRAFTAWALFNWETLVGFSFMFAPLLNDPPTWDLPDPSEGANWYGEIWVKYPVSSLILPSYFGHVIRARSQFRVIMNQACQAAYSAGSGVDLGKARELLSRLRAWYDGLSGPLLPRTIVLPGHLQLHMYYQHLILTIFEPLHDVETEQQPYRRQVIADARKHLYTLIRLYYLRHGYEAMDLFIVIPLMLAASDCIDCIDERTPEAELDSLRSTLILVAKGLYEQRRNHYLAEALSRVIRGRMRPSEAALFRHVMNIDKDEADTRPDLAQAVRSHWPVSVVKKKEDLDSYVLTNLVENYAHMGMGEGRGEAVSEADDPLT